MAGNEVYTIQTVSSVIPSPLKPLYYNSYKNLNITIYENKIIKNIIKMY
jgi:hypothetical protein